MPRFPVAFGRRKSTADNDNGAIAEPSFRVLDRSEVAAGKSVDGGRLSAKQHTFPKQNVSDITVEDNLFADLKTNRGSGSSNTTKTASTDNSSRHSNVSTTPSSADLGGQDEWKSTGRKPLAEGSASPVPKSSSGFSLKAAAGRTFSFGGQKKQLPPPPPVVDEPLPPVPPPHSEGISIGGRERATTTSTAATVTPLKLESEFNLDLGGDFSKMFGFDKRASVLTVRGEDSNSRQALGPRSLTGNRLNQPSPIQIDKTTKVDTSPYSWNSQHSNDGLLSSSPHRASPTNENAPPRIPRQPSPLAGRSGRPVTSPEPQRPSAFLGRRPPLTEEVEDEDTRLLKDSLSAVSKFMAGGNTTNSGSSSRYRREEDTLGSSWKQTSESKAPRLEPQSVEEDSLFDSSLAHSSRIASRFVARKPSPPRNKVMTRAQFERYKQDKERQNAGAEAEKSEDKSDEEDNYEDDEDDVEKAKQQAKQRRKQEAHMAVYRQQMMKVTGESSSGMPSRPSLQISVSTPSLPNLSGSGPSPAGKSSDSDEDEEVPLAILAAHGFPNKNRPPTRLSTMMSNPNLRAAQQPSYQKPGSVVGDAPPAAPSGRLPAFARNLPKDPFLGAGLVHNSVRESFALGGGAPAPGHPVAPLPPGGLVGVIANEERARALRRGSPAIDAHNPLPVAGPSAFDPIGGIPPHMLYPNRPVSTLLTPADQAQMQMNQQMQQFMQMQMQFMQMMAGQGGNTAVRPSTGHMPGQSISNLGDIGMGGVGPDVMRHSFIANGSVLDLPRGDAHVRTMSMVQPSSSSWIQSPINPGYAPSIHIQGAGYAPSIAPSERSNIGLPGRYRPVSHMPPPVDELLPRSSTMPPAIGSWNEKQPPKVSIKKSGNNSDDDDEEGWQAMKARREKKRSLWKSKKSFGADIGALIS